MLTQVYTKPHLRNVRREALEIPMSQRTHHRPGRAGRVRAPRTPPRLERRAATAERRQLSPRTGSRPSPREATTGAMVKPARGRARTLNPVFDASVWRCDRLRAGMQCEPDHLLRVVWCDGYDRRVLRLVPKRRGSGLPGVKLDTYRITGLFSERGCIKPPIERRDRRTRQAAKPSDVSVEGRSLRSSSI